MTVASTASTTADFVNICAFGSVKLFALTGGTLCWATRPEREFPDVLAIGTLECSRFVHFYLPSFDSQRHTFHQDLGHLLAG
jgi:hypothetical protein